MNLLFSDNEWLYCENSYNELTCSENYFTSMAGVSFLIYFIGSNNKLLIPEGSA